MTKHKSYQEEYEAIKAFERLPENRIKVSAKLENPHPIVADTLKVLTHNGLKGLCSTPEQAPVICTYDAPTAATSAYSRSANLY